jgi:hypothetical protein
MAHAQGAMGGQVIPTNQSFPSREAQMNRRDLGQVSDNEAVEIWVTRVC